MPIYCCMCKCHEGVCVCVCILSTFFVIRRRNIMFAAVVGVATSAVYAHFVHLNMGKWWSKKQRIWTRFRSLDLSAIKLLSHSFHCNDAHKSALHRWKFTVHRDKYTHTQLHSTYTHTHANISIYIYKKQCHKPIDNDWQTHIIEIGKCTFVYTKLPSGFIFRIKSMSHWKREK